MFRWLTLLTLAVSCLGLPARAEEIPSNLVHAEVIGGWRMADGRQMTAVRLTLAPGWKTYWRAPGEAGIPPSFDWTGSQNVGAVAFHWPTPEIFDLNGFRVLGYRDELVLPITVTPTDSGEPVALAAKIDLGVCETVCVPVTVDVKADLPHTTAQDAEIRKALSRLPEKGPDAGLRSATCAVQPIRDGLRLTTKLDIPAEGRDEYAVIELADPSVWVSPPELSRDGGTLTAVADLVPSNAAPFALNRSDIRITLFGGGRAVEIDGCTG